MDQGINIKKFYVQEDGQVSGTNENTILCNVTVNGEKHVMKLEKEVLQANGITVPDEILVPVPIAVGSNSMSSLLEEESSRLNCPRPIEWGIDDTKFVLERHEQYVSQIGPMMRFKNKKAMWIEISKELKDFLALNRSSTQCETRFKTVMKRKKDVVWNNKTSVATHQVVENEEELTEITTEDDSVGPEVMRNLGREKKKKPNSSFIKMAKNRIHSNAVAAAMLKIHRLREEGRQKREESKQKRHEERMAMFERLLK